MPDEPNSNPFPDQNLRSNLTKTNKSKLNRSKHHKPNNILIIIIVLIAFFLCMILATKLLTDQANSQEHEQNQNQKSAIRIIDGDTFEINNEKNGGIETIRLICVDTPEQGKEGFEEATGFLSSMILGKELKIERNGTDKYNRQLAWVYVKLGDSSILVNNAIIDKGLGILFEYNGTNCSRMG